MGYIGSAKKIKFNLRCDENSVRTIEDLQNNFVIEDILEYFQNGLLQRWLDVRDYKEEKDAVDQLKNRGVVEPLELARELATIFHVEDNVAIIERDIYILRYQQERINFLTQFDNLTERTEELITNYFNQYERIVQDIIQNNEDYNWIKAAVEEIAKNYTDIFKYDYERLLVQLKEKAPLAMYVMLMNDTMREQYLNDSEICKKQIIDFNNETCSIVKNGTDDGRYKSWMRYINYFGRERSNTSGNWFTLVSRVGSIGENGVDEGKKCLILTLNVTSANTSNKPNIRENDRRDMSLSISDVCDRFMVLNGLDYQCGGPYGYVIYMEV